jgi:hypothetical protein
MACRRLVPTLLATLGLLVGAAGTGAGAGAAHAAPFLPPGGKVWAGVTGDRSANVFAGQVGNRPPVFGFFTFWDQDWRFIFRSVADDQRLMLHISTSDGYGAREVITPLGIARGAGDSYLVRLNRRLAALDRPTYVRFLSEMNQANNGYSAYTRGGARKGPSHSTTAFKDAWRRAALILRGGPVAGIDAGLRRLGLPAVRGVAAQDELPRPQVAMAWVPQTRGSPDVPGNMPRAYWPGARYVDWVGTDFYSRFPRFEWLSQFYNSFRRKPFLFGEWALWGADNPAFVRQLFGWVRSHGRVRMLMYNQGNRANGPFRLFRYPRGRAELRRQLGTARFR